MFFTISETVTYQTSLSPDSIASYLNEVIEPPKAIRWGFWEKSKPYEGTADQYSFKMHKISRGKNSTFAQAEGTIKQVANHTIVDVQLSMPVFIRIFALAWLGFVTFFAITSFSLSNNSDIPALFKYIPVLMIFFGTGLFFGGYKWHANSLKNDLKRILQAEIII